MQSRTSLLLVGNQGAVGKGDNAINPKLSALPVLLVAPLNTSVWLSALGISPGPGLWEDLLQNLLHQGAG